MTDLLTICHNANCLFSANFGVGKFIKEIFSKLDEMKTQGPISPDTTTESKEEMEEGTDTSQTYL